MDKIIYDDVRTILSSDIPFERFYGKTILISGANGYVPAYFVHTFLALNDDRGANTKVLALCRNGKKAKSRFSGYIGRKDFKIIVQDVCDPIEVGEVVHAYIHAASPAGVEKRYEDPVNTFLANVKGAENMLDSAVDNPCEYFLFLSSVDVYGRVEGCQRLREDACGCLDPLDMRNVYSCGKRAAETLCKAYQVKYNLPLFIVRPVQIIGPGLELDDGRLHIDFISQMLKGDNITLKSDGMALRAFMYITDAITAMLTIMFKGKSGEAYNVVCESGEASVRGLADIMASAVRDRDIKIVYDYGQRDSIEVKGALPSVVGDSSKLAGLGWKPKLSLSEGASRMVAYYGLSTG